MLFGSIGIRRFDVAYSLQYNGLVKDGVIKRGEVVDYEQTGRAKKLKRKPEQEIVLSPEAGIPDEDN